MQISPTLKPPPPSIAFPQLKLKGSLGPWLHLSHTHVERFPRESLQGSCSAENNGVRGLSACSVISTISHTSAIGFCFRSRAADKGEASGRI